jgi:hypothetical protein
LLNGRNDSPAVIANPGRKETHGVMVVDQAHPYDPRYVGTLITPDETINRMIEIPRRGMT